MTRNEFRLLAADKILLDGAFGTELVKRGMPEGVCPELWTLEHPEAAREILCAYRDAGSRIVFAPTFGGNAVKLDAYGLKDRAGEINRDLVRLAKEAVPDTFVFGDLSSTGRFVEPFGDLAFEDAVRIFREQTEALISGGADGIAVETMMDLQEARAALLGAREVPGDFPVLVSMTFEASGRSLTGTDPVSALVTLQALGADAFGCNCSADPEDMAKILLKLKDFAQIPLIAKPNAGIPHLRNGKTVFPMIPEDFAKWTRLLFDAGAACFGGCCGTTPEHLAYMKKALDACGKPFRNAAPVRGVVASASRYRVLAPGAPFAVIGERINPTGKKLLQQELREGKTDLVFDFAVQQTQAKAALLDVNAGLGGIDEKSLMLKMLKKVLKASDLPLSIDSADPGTVEAALRFYPGRALLNSISAEKERLEKILPVAAKYGAMIVLLPLTDEGIPSSLRERVAVVEKLLDDAARYGYSPQEVCIDALVMAVSADPGAAETSLDLIGWAKAHNLNSVCGLSNVSFGLPGRSLLNRTFLGMAIGRGLNMAIANPLFEDVMTTALAADALAGKDVRQKDFLAYFSSQTSEDKSVAQIKNLSPRDRIFRAVLDGDADGVVPAVECALAEKIQPMEILDSVLIPAITEVGAKYEKKEYFLPQLVAGAEAMQNATKFLEPLLTAKDAKKKKTRILFATVRGDVHDIGKNIVIAMLKNYGFDVLDLGKDVPPEMILDTAVREKIGIVALSALMTTTMKSMRETVELARKRNLADLKFLVGGAVVDEVFAREIGAYYTADPMATVRAAQKLSQ